jgi:hypothetical protein
MQIADIFGKARRFLRHAAASKAPGQQSTSGWQLRPNDGQGIFTQYFQNYVPRKVEASFYEFLREAIPIIDAAITRLVSLDGHIIVKGKNEALVSDIEDWMKSVAVNDIQKGMQSFHQNLSNEGFEQGFGLGEYVTDKKRSDIVGLRVADSKYIRFKRNGSTLEIYQKADGDSDYRLLNPANILYFSINNENQNPYGTPLMRSCEFVAKILATMHNSLLNNWERFGDPSFSIVYKTSKKDGGELAARRQMLETEFNTAIRAKREGKSADFVRAIDIGSDIEIKIIGADGQILEIEAPARHVLEQIVAKTGLPAWMLGMHWSTTERLSNAEVEVLLADVQTRQSAKLPIFENVIKTRLLLQGRTWRKGDWWLEWGQVNLHDLVAQAQARFLNAQADMYYLQNAAAAGITISIEDLAIGKGTKDPTKEIKFKMAHQIHGPGCDCGAKELRRPFDWPEIDQLEKGYEDDLKGKWSELSDRVLTILKLSDQKGAKSDLPAGVPLVDQFTWSDEQRSAIQQALKRFIGEYDLRDRDSAVRWYYGQALSEGYFSAAYMIGKDKPILNLIANQKTYDQICKEGFQLVKDNATKAIINKILPEIEAQVLAGTNPKHIGSRLHKLFGEQNSDWERLARTEMTAAAEAAKLSEWEAWKVSKVEFVPAPDGCAFCQSLAGEYEIAQCPCPGRDTHPRCRCSTRPGKSEVDRA